MNLLPLQQGIIYGPLKSRRLGRSLGINLLPTAFKLCSLNCSYCQYGWTKELTNCAEKYREYLPSVTDVTQSLAEVLRFHKEIDCLTFSGNGEPTLHPDFPEIMDETIRIKEKLMPQLKIAVLSNSTTCWSPKIKAALVKIDQPIMKLDVGNQASFKKMNHGPAPVTFDKIFDGLKSLSDITIQTMFVRGKGDNSTDQEVKSWINRLEEINPLWVQIYSLDRGTASDQLERVEPARLQEIANMAKEMTGLLIEVY